ncbi:MAG: helicase C-terminal domain-containing protein [Dehalococcoidia bacterium]
MSGATDQLYVSLDLETTGFSPENDEIIEIGAVKFRGEETLDTFHSLVNPRRPLPHQIQSLTGIAPSELEVAPQRSEVAVALTSFVGRSPIVGQRISFDLGFLAARGIAFTGPTFDTYELGRFLLPSLPDHSLPTLAGAFGIACPSLHRALPHALVTGELFSALLQRARGLHPSLIAEIVRLTDSVRWPWRTLFLDMAGAGGPGPVPRALEPLPLAISGEEPAEPELGSPDKRAPGIDELVALLEPEGRIGRAFPGFEYRPEQVNMLRGVAEALHEARHLIVEAGTGTGKSLAYLLPAVSFALSRRTPVILSTNTINLQEQLIGKDIPELQRALSPEWSKLRVALLKGRANYLCLRRWDFLRQSQGLSATEIRFLLRILIWLAETRAGDRAGLPLRGQEVALWNQVSAQGDCSAEACPHYGRCFLFRARHRAERAHVVVTNHALILSEIASGSRVLPEYRHLIVDEAHHLEEEATEQWGFRLTRQQLVGYCDHLSQRLREGKAGLLARVRGSLFAGALDPLRRKDLGQLIDGLERRVETARLGVQRFFDTLARFLEDHSAESGEYERRLRLTGAVHTQPAWSGVELAGENLSLALGGVETGLGQLHSSLESLSPAQVSDRDSLLAEIAFQMVAARQFQGQVNSAVLSPERETVYWGSLGPGGAVGLSAAPLEVGEVLERLLFSQKDSVILTGATLSTQGSFQYVRERLGLEEGEEMMLGSSFDYLASTLLYIATDIPEPDRPGYRQAVEGCLVELCRALGGRTLVLFTSHAALRSTQAAIRPFLEESGLLVLGQGVDGSPEQILATFRDSPGAVLLGTSSFWEGVDVAGEALSVLVIPRLPFSVPTDPVFAARSEMYEEPFTSYVLPQAALRLKQGFGRLIRRRSDRGVLVILDCRLKSKRYGAAFLESLPPYTVKSGSASEIPGEVVRWLGGSG